MKNRRQQRSLGLDYDSLESRQVLTSFVDFALPQRVVHIPINETHTVLQDLTEAPEISQEPENGTLIFDEFAGTLVYLPNDGFVGADDFQIEDQTTNIRVWHSAWATPDWANVVSGESASIDVLANDYAFLERDDSHSLHFYLASGFQWQQNSTGFTIVDVTAPDSGTVSISNDGRSLNFESVDGFVGQTEVTYTLEDSRGFRSTGNVVVDVTTEVVDSRSYASDAHWQQHSVEAWMERHAGSLARGGSFWLGTDDLIEVGVVRATVGGAGNAVQFDAYAEVQEGDIVKSDGELLYYVTYGNGSDDFQSFLSIIDVSDSDAPVLLSTTGFESYIKDIFLDEDRVAVVSTENFGYYAGSGFDLQVLDVTSPVVPTEVYAAEIEGSYTDARLIGNQLYLVSQFDINSGNGSWEVLEDDTIAVSPGDYVDAIVAKDGFDLPEISVSVDDVTTTVSLGVDQVVRREGGNASTLVTTFNVQGNGDGPTDTDLIESDYVSTVYVSAQSFYLFDGASVMKLSVEAGAGVEFSADGTLEGTLLNHFSADEYGGYLRVAMTDWADGSSDVRIFEQVGDSLNVVGSLDDIAPGERIFSTTFVEDQVFVVTFRQIDPLFVIDLSDATAPTITGELKIPGVSNYLQLIDDDILLAVGRDADPETGQQSDLQISLFDVSDSHNPQLLDRYTFAGGRQRFTPLIDWLSARPDHQALTFDQSTGTLALPTQQNYGSEATHDVSVFNISRAGGIQVSGSVSFASRSQRTVISGERVVYFSDRNLKTATTIEPSAVIATLELPPEESEARAVGASMNVCEMFDRVFEESVDAETVELVSESRPVFVEAEREPLDVELVNNVLPAPQFFAAVKNRSFSDRLVSLTEANVVSDEPDEAFTLNKVDLAADDVRPQTDDFLTSFESELGEKLEHSLSSQELFAN